MNKKLGITALLCSALLAVVPSLHAAVVQNEKQDFVLEDFVECADGGNGEMIHVAGTLHVLASTTVHGNTISGHTLFSPQGVSGYGLTTGLKYHAVGMTGESFSGTLDGNNQTKLTYVNSYHLVGQGKGNNFLIKQTIHYTINAKGIVAVSFDNTRFVCH